MPRPSCRPFTIADGMILIVGLAVGLALMLYWPGSDEFGNRVCQIILVDSVPIFLCLNTAMFVLRLGRARPRFWRLARQPGMATSMAILGVVLFNLPFVLVGSLGAHELDLGSMVPEVDTFGTAVIFTWLTLFLTRAWKSERGWIDLSGRILGGIWIGLWAFGLCARHMVIPWLQQLFHG